VREPINLRSPPEDAGAARPRPELARPRLVKPVKELFAFPRPVARPPVPPPQPLPVVLRPPARWLRAALPCAVPLNLLNMLIASLCPAGEMRNRGVPGCGAPSLAVTHEPVDP
jgi:hypothetical protein